MVLETGTAAPDVRARNQHGEPVKPDFDEPAVVYFYPRDGTPGCTTEACQFDAELSSYRNAGVTVYGVSTDDVASHRAFAEAEGIEFDLLADPDGEIAAAFDVPVEDDRAARTTFVVVDGTIVGVYEGVRPDGHAREVLRDLAEAGLAPMG